MHNILRYRPLRTFIYSTGGGSSGGGSSFTGRAGSVPADNNSLSKIITFSSALSDTNYAIVPIFSNIVDATPQFQPIVPTAISVGGFTASWNGNLDSANYVINYLVQPIASTASAQAGKASVSSGVSSKVITFGTAMTSANYSVQACLINVTDSTPQFQTVTPTAMDVNGFTGTWNAPTDSANYILSYIVTPNS